MASLNEHKRYYPRNLLFQDGMILWSTAINYNVWQIKYKPIHTISINYFNIHIYLCHIHLLSFILVIKCQLFWQSSAIWYCLGELALSPTPFTYARKKIISRGFSKSYKNVRSIISTMLMEWINCQSIKTLSYSELHVHRLTKRSSQRLILRPAQRKIDFGITNLKISLTSRLQQINSYKYNHLTKISVYSLLICIKIMKDRN